MTNSFVDVNAELDEAHLSLEGKDAQILELSQFAEQDHSQIEKL